MFNNKILKIMPYVLGGLILVLIAVLVFMKLGDDSSEKETKVASEKTADKDAETISSDLTDDKTRIDTADEGKDTKVVDSGASLTEIKPEENIKIDPTPIPEPEPEVEPEPEPEPEAEPDPTPTPTPTPVALEFEDKDDYVETKSDVNLRQGPSTQTDVVANLKTAKRLKRTGYNKEWTRVIYEDKECYIYTPLVTGTFDEPTEDGNAAPSTQTGTATLTTGVGTPNGHIVCIDPGHQTKGNSDKEPLGPGSSEMKAKVSSGTSGNTSGLAEYKLNLTVSLKLRDELVARGYTVVMTREINDVDISNAERAKIAADAGAQAFVRIHANSSSDTSVNGVETICMTNENKYNAELYTSSRKLSDAILNNVVSSTGAKKRYVWETDTMTGINWAEVPVTILEMGYMSNKDEEEKLIDDNYQNKIVLGIADGIDEFFR